MTLVTHLNSDALEFLSTNPQTGLVKKRLFENSANMSECTSRAYKLYADYKQNIDHSYLIELIKECCQKPNSDTHKRIRFALTILTAEKTDAIRHHLDTLIKIGVVYEKKDLLKSFKKCIQPLFGKKTSELSDNKLTRLINGIYKTKRTGHRNDKVEILGYTLDESKIKKSKSDKISNVEFLEMFFS
jgi:hypothetical protein